MGLDTRAMEAEPPGVATIERELGVPIDGGSVTTSIEVDRLGGIEHAELTLTPGVTVLSGENATNRTSLLRAINGVLGGTMASLRSDADQGTVRLAVRNGSDAIAFHRSLERVAPAGTTPDDARRSGEPMADDPTVVDTFVSVLEANEARRAVDRGGDGLREVLLGPLDTEEIERHIADTRRRRDEVDERIGEIDEQLQEEKALRERRQAVRTRLEEVEREIAAVKDRVAELEKTEAATPEAQRLVDELDRRRDHLRQLDEDVELKRSEGNALGVEADAIAERRNELEANHGLDGNDEGRTIDARIDDLRQRRRALDDRRDAAETIVEELVQLISVTERLLEDPAFSSVRTVDGPPDSEIRCWTCGAGTNTVAVTDRLEELRDQLGDHRSRLRDLEEEYEQIEDELSALETIRDTYRDHTERLERIRSERAVLEDEVAALISEREAAEEAVAELEEQLEAVSEDRESTLVETKSRLTDLRHERGRLEAQSHTVTEELEELARLADTREELVEQRSTIREELDALRNRISTIETRAIDRFNDTMETVVDRLNYRNIGRVWLERREPDTGARFDLHIAREEDGTTWSDTVAHLSESERTVVGIVVAVTGYMVHEVGDDVPFLLLDSVEAIDADRLVALAELLLEHATFLLVALLPEDAAAFAETHEIMTPEQWRENV